MELKIFLTDLNKYNDGQLFGEWIDVFDVVNECNDVDECITKSLKQIGIDVTDPNCHEWFITDYETDLDVSIGEHESLETIFNFAKEVLNADTKDVNVINCVLRYYGDGFNADLSRVDDVVVISGTNGVYDLSDLGYEMAEMMDIFHDCPETLERYFDFEAYGRDIDLEVNGFFEDGCYYYMI